MKYLLRVGNEEEILDTFCRRYYNCKFCPADGFVCGDSGSYEKLFNHLIEKGVVVEDKE